MKVAAHVDALSHGFKEASQRLGGVANPLVVIGGRDPVLSNKDGNAFGNVPGVADSHAESVRTVCRADQGVVGVGRVRDEAVGVHFLAGVGLDTDEVVAPAALPVDVLFAVPDFKEFFLPAGGRGEGAGGDGPSDLGVRACAHDLSSGVVDRGEGAA